MRHDFRRGLFEITVGCSMELWRSDLVSTPYFDRMGRITEIVKIFVG